MMALLKGLKYALSDPHARILIVRLSYPMLKAIGGIIEESQHIYKSFGAEWKVQALEWHFKNGAVVKFVAMPQDRTEVQGWAATTIIIDEGAEFQLEDILALRARLRGARYKGKISMIITCNPSRTSWLYAPWVEWCLDPVTGVPRDGTENTIKWFVIQGTNIRFGDSPEQLHELYGSGMELGKTFIPISFRFIPMDIYSNPVLLKNNPQYLADLLSQSRVNQLRFLSGSWTAVSSGSTLVDREKITFVDSPPRNYSAIVRSWDLASTKPNEVNKDPDYTAGVLVCREDSGHYTILHCKRFRETPDIVLKTIADTAKEDGLEVLVSVPREVGSAGAMANKFMTSSLGEAGLNLRTIPISGHAGKVKRFLPVATVIAGGHFSILRDTAEDRWNEDLLTELEHFDGHRNKHDDQVDAISDAFKVLASGSTIPSFSLPTLEKASPIPRL